MIEPLLQETCFVGTSNLVPDVGHGGISAYDLVEYGCEGDRRLILRRQRIEIHARLGAVSVATIVKTVRGVNNYLAMQPHCSCIRKQVRRAAG